MWRFTHKKKTDPTANAEMAKKRVHDSAKKFTQKNAELRKLIETNGFTLRIYNAMGGKHSHGS